jgi:hypothetical protein
VAERCERTDLLVDQCACPDHRGGEVGGLPDEIETVGQPFEAQYEGQCAGCAGHIEPGQRIARVADVPGAYVHTEGCR